ncbi:methyltransferase domain-containing protein [Aquipuribacter nitratireducens]|uniref:Methyltransferase domain-containing protein n=1 Tax=Aquipuribacter nitratireducens TaxID=650104 RepID=A0ABW0GPP6_9MICO
MPRSGPDVLRRAVLAFSIRSRRRKAAAIGRFLADHDVRDCIFVGCSPGTNLNEGIVERAVAARARVFAAFDVLHAEPTWPFLRADATRMPFADGAADMLLANAVIEHVGDEADQRRFVAEHVRVGRTFVITTPNRWFPMESHTATLFRHWSPRWRASRSEFTRLLSLREFRDLLPPGTRVVGRPWSATFTAYYAGRPPLADERGPGPAEQADVTSA